MRLLIAAVLLASPAGAMTTISSTKLQGAGGVPAYGQICVTPTVPFTAASGAQVEMVPKCFPVRNGSVTITLEPNDTATPANTGYDVEYQLTNGKQHTETWTVETSVTPLAIRDVQAQSGLPATAYPASGDVCGSFPAPVVCRIQGRAVAGTAPTDGQAYRWSAADQQWEPGSVASSYAQILGQPCDNTPLCTVLAAKLAAALVGTANGVAPLGPDGIVPGSYLPAAGSGVQTVDSPGGTVNVGTAGSAVHLDVNPAKIVTPEGDNDLTGQNRTTYLTGFISVPNNSSSGTVTNQLACLAADGNATVCPSATADKILGVCASGCGTTGNARIAVLGLQEIEFDGGVTANHYVQMSPSVNGKATDAGLTAPSSGQVIGLARETSANPGTYAVLLTVYSVGINLGAGGTAVNTAPLTSGSALCGDGGANLRPCTYFDLPFSGDPGNPVTGGRLRVDTITRIVTCVLADGSSCWPASMAHHLLGTTHSDTAPASPMRGDLMTGQAGPVWARMGRGASGQIVGYDTNDVKPISLGANLSGDGSEIRFNPADTTTIWTRDDFGYTGGSASLYSDTGWTTYATPGSIYTAWPTVEANHPGITRIGTRAATPAANDTALAIKFASGAGTLYQNMGTGGAWSAWQGTFIVRPDATGAAGPVADTTVYGGWASQVVFGPPANFIGFAVSTSEVACTSGVVATGHWYFVASNGSSSQCLDTGTAAQALTWYKFDFVSTTPGTIAVALDGSSIGSLSSYVPTSGGSPGLRVITLTTAQKTVDVDLYAFQLRGLTR